MAELFDTHAHLDANDYDADRDQVIERARQAGVTRILCVAAGGGFASAERVAAIFGRQAGIWMSIGVHPHDAAAEYDLEKLLRLGADPQVVAIGETGLDYHYDLGPRDRQEQWLRLHIEAARQLHKPLIIHSRESGEECLRVLREMRAEEIGGVFHCYPGDAEFATKLRDMNFLVSFNGILTFKKALAAQTAAREIPLSQIILETDAPYLAPVPHRGKRCEPAMMVESAKMLAALKGVTLEEVAAVTTANALRLFTIQS